MSNSRCPSFTFYALCFTPREEAAMKSRAVDEYVQVNNVDWQPFPGDFSGGGIRWKLLHVSPEAGAWTAIFDCPKGSSFASHVHRGPGEYLLTKGKMEVLGG